MEENIDDAEVDLMARELNNRDANSNSSVDDECYFNNDIKRKKVSKSVILSDDECQDFSKEQTSAEKRKMKKINENADVRSFLSMEAIEEKSQENSDSDISTDSSDADFIDDKYIYTPRYLYLRDDIF